MFSPIYKQFYRENGARYPDALTRIPEFTLKSFPRESVFHVYDDGDGVPDIDASKPYLKGYSRKIIAEIVTELSTQLGPVRPWTFNTVIAIQPWKRSHIQSWQIEDDITKVHLSPDQLAVVSYGYTDKCYKYQPVQMVEYYRWHNRMNTIYSRMNEIASATGRQQFIIIKLPQVLQGRSILDRYADKDISTAMMTIFGTGNGDGFFQLDLWRFLSSSHRHLSLLNLINPKNYAKVDLIIEGVTGKQILLNLGYLNSWIKGQPNSTEFSSVVQFDNVNVQKLLLKLCINLNGALDEGDEDATVRATAQPEAGAEVQASSDDEVSETTSEDNRAIDAAGVVKGKSISPITEVKETPIVDVSKPGKLSEDLFAEIEADIEALDRISLVSAKNKGILNHATPGKKVTEEVNPELLAQEIPEVTISQEDAVKKLFDSKDPVDVLSKRLADDAEAGLITAAEYRRMVEAAAAFNESEDPYGSGKKRNVASKITAEDTVLAAEDSEIVASDAVVDRTMCSSSLQAYNRKYLRNVYKKDVLNAVSRLQASGVIVKKHEVERTTSILGTYEHHRLELRPVDGQPSTVSFSLPVVEKDGTFMASGNKYFARKQRVDLPIRKIAPSIVGLSTYYGKTFVQISPKVVNNSLAWIVKQINTAIITEGSYITDVALGNAFDNEFKAPYIYNALANEFEGFTAGKNVFFFNHRTRASRIDESTLKSIEKNSRVFCGISERKKPIIVDRSNHFYEVDGGTELNLGDVYAVLHLEKADAPVDFSEVRVFSKYVPVGVVLGYYIGFKALIAALGAEYRIVEPRKNKMLKPGEYAIVFKDKTYVFNSNKRFESLILAGFGDYEKVTKLYESDLFDNKDVYLNLLMSKGFGALYVRELDMMENAFVDHISEEILRDMKEPTTFKGLLYRATELLQTYHHPVSQDRSAMRDRGYERFAGAVYKELTQAVRQFRNKNLIGRSKIDISPYQVWNSIMKDSSIKIVEDINPIQNLKESEIVTFSGVGGRDKETMTKPSRAFHVSDAGITSESTVDNAGVGTVVYMSANPNIASVRGLVPAEKTLNATSMMSTAALSSPCSFKDNPKRIMFINTQHSHTIASAAYRQPYIRTGYEKVAARRTTKLFSTGAEMDGVVMSVTDRGMVVKYADGREDSIPLGRQYGKAEGTVYPHDLITRLTPGKKFKKGDILAYNEKFFEPDFLNPAEVNMKVSGFATVAFLEDKSTHEDSCTISPSMGAQFQTEVTKVKSYVVRFDQGIQNLVKIGQEVSPRDVLMVIEDALTSSGGNFSEESLDSLKRLANVAPRSGVSGLVEKIEVYYNGDKRDMSPTLKRITDRSDADIATDCKSTNKPVLNGQVGEEYRVKGTPLELDQAEIKIYLTIKSSTGVGDKVVFGHQMKSTIAEVHPSEIVAADGTKIDAIFSYRSLAAREVNSTNLVGAATVLLDLAAKRALAAYSE